MKHSLQRFFAPTLLLGLFAMVLAACGGGNSTNAQGQVVLRLGYFSNITHAPALVGLARGTFASDLGKNVQLKPTIFNAGPAEIEALLAGDIDIGYVGPSPAVNGYVQSNGSALKIIAGAADAGAEFIVRPGAHISQPSDLNGKNIATPQLGNTQDIALRYYLQQHGLKTKDNGGTVTVTPTNSNSEILTLFKQGKIDGAWVPEPYASRLVVEDGGQVFVNEATLWPGGQFATTEVVVRTQFLKAHSDIVKNFLKAHIETVQYINTNLTDAATLVNQQLVAQGGTALKSAVLTRSFSDLSITYDPLTSSVSTAAQHAYALGFLKSNPDLSGIFDLSLLNQELQAQGLAPLNV